MKLSWEAKLVIGITLLSVPTIMYGGITLLGLITGGSVGLAPGAVELNSTQQDLWRAGHAHAGVWVILAIVIQICLDGTDLSDRLTWIARVSAPLAAITVSGGFFGLAFFNGFRWLIYFGGLCLFISVTVTGVGLLLNLK